MFDEVVPMLITILQLYSYVLVARIILSWIPTIDRSNPIVQFIYQITEPVLEPVRRALPQIAMVDLSIIVVFIGLRVLQSLLEGLVR